MKLRPWRPGDEPSLVKYANNRKISINMRDRFPFPYTQADAESWIKLANETDPVENFAIEFENQAVGGIGLMLGTDIYRKSAEIGYWLGEPYWGKGLMPEAVKRMTEYGFETFGLNRIFAGVFESNSASARVLEKAGYAFEYRTAKSVYKEGRYLDQLFYVKLR